MSEKRRFPKCTRYTANAEIREEMYKRGISQKAFAKEIQASVTDVSRWLKEELPDNMKLAIMETLRRMDQ